MSNKKDVECREKIDELAVALQGLQTVSTICKKMGISRKTAINYVYELRKAGFVRTTRGNKKLRIYEISSVSRRDLGYPGFYDIINKYSPLKIAKPYEHRVYKPLAIEEVIVRAIKMQDFRTVLASLALFRHVSDWSLLYTYSKKENVRRKVGALYELSRQVVRVRRIDKRIGKKLLLGTDDKFIIPDVHSKDFHAIEKKWKVYIPFNRKDLSKLKE